MTDSQLKKQYILADVDAMSSQFSVRIPTQPWQIGLTSFKIRFLDVRLSSASSSLIGAPDQYPAFNILSPDVVSGFPAVVANCYSRGISAREGIQYFVYSEKSQIVNKSVNGPDVEYIFTFNTANNSPVMLNYGLRICLLITD